MDRGSFISTVAGALLAAPLGAEAQPAGKVYRVGFLDTFPQRHPTPNGDAFVQGLREAGYVEGQNLSIERRDAEGKVERLPSLAADLMRLGVSVIITTRHSPPLLRCLRSELARVFGVKTNTIPPRLATCNVYNPE